MIKKIAYGLLVISLIIIFTGLILKIHKDNKIIKEKDSFINQQAQQINKLNAENEALWDNYYMNVTNYESYNYYE